MSIEGSDYRVMRIRKKSGGWREIAVPSVRYRDYLQTLLPPLYRIQAAVCGNCVHGFMPGRSPVTNAAVHVGYLYTLSLDLADFFDSITVPMISTHIPEPLLAVPPRRPAMQGLPTSPAIANIAAAPLDAAILSLLAWWGVECRYTRYADDLTISTNEITVVTRNNRKSIIRRIESCGFKANPRKTRIQFASRGRRIITGVAVGVSDVTVPRSIKRKMRAAEHQGNRLSLRGLREWAKLKMPNSVATAVSTGQPVVTVKKIAAVRRVIRKIEWGT